MSPGEKYLVNYSRPDPSDPDPEVSASFLPFFPLFQSDEKFIKLVHLQGFWLKFFDVTSGKGLFGVKNDVACD